MISFRPRRSESFIGARGRQRKKRSTGICTPAHPVAGGVGKPWSAKARQGPQSGPQRSRCGAPKQPVASMVAPTTPVVLKSQNGASYTQPQRQNVVAITYGKSEAASSPDNALSSSKAAHNTGGTCSFETAQ